MGTSSSLQTMEDALRLAQCQAEELFRQVESRGCIRPGITEKALSDEVFALAETLFGIKKYWHKRIVRTGPNTVCPYHDNPPDRLIASDDILFFDFGPIFEDYEADYGRTYVLGEDPVKHKLQADLETLFLKGKQHYGENPAMTGAQLFHYMVTLAEEAGWCFGAPTAGHVIGKFPHEKTCDSPQDYIGPENHQSMNEPDGQGGFRHWILEVHLVDPARSFGGFYEDLLTLNAL